MVQGPVCDNSSYRIFFLDLSFYFQFIRCPSILQYQLHPIWPSMHFSFSTRLHFKAASIIRSSAWSHNFNVGQTKKCCRRKNWWGGCCLALLPSTNCYWPVFTHWPCDMERWMVDTIPMWNVFTVFPIVHFFPICFPSKNKVEPKIVRATF